jgi:hypothetical protein
MVRSSIALEGRAARGARRLFQHADAVTRLAAAAAMPQARLSNQMLRRS